LAGHNPPRALPGEPALWERTYWEYWFFADRFGWLPSQVDNESAVILERLRDVALTVEEFQRERDDG
jgi:hypothetical protein